jgi:molybdopterin synthase catalytic subunit
VKTVVRLFAVLRERAGTSELELHGLQQGLDVSALKRELEARHPELGPLASVRCAVDNAYADESTVLVDGAEVSLIPPVSGGSDAAEADLERGVFELLQGPIDPLACQRRVEHPACGACCVFTGMVRDTNRERSVLRMEYEAFEQMTGPEMGRIFDRCRDEMGAERLRMLVQHRVGNLAVGDASVIVCVASAHRDPAFRACRFLIDELKRSLPVWKKEFYPGDEHWIGDRS